MDMRNVALNGQTYTLLHDEPGIGERKSIWSASAYAYEMTWVGSETDFIGGFGPPPGMSLDPYGKALTIGFTAIGIAEAFAWGAEAVPVAPLLTPVFWSAGVALFIIMVNTAYAPTK